MEQQDISGMEFIVAENKSTFEGNPNLNEDDWFPAVLTEISVWPSEQYGPSLNWYAELQEEKFQYEYNGVKKRVRVQGNTSMKVSPKTKLYAWYSKLIGQEPGIGTKINLKALIGMHIFVMLKAKKGKEDKVYYNIDKLKPDNSFPKPWEKQAQAQVQQPAVASQPVPQTVVESAPAAPVEVKQTQVSAPVTPAAPVTPPPPPPPAAGTGDIFEDIFDQEPK